MKLHTDILIMSGEGTGPGTIQRYYGPRTAAAIKARLTKERALGDRWATAWIELAESERHGDEYCFVYGQLDDGLELTGEERAIAESDIYVDISTAAALIGHKGRSVNSEAQKRASRTNGIYGGRPQGKKV
jgi:hypothetical protein